MLLAPPGEKPASTVRSPNIASMRNVMQDGAVSIRRPVVKYGAASRHFGEPEIAADNSRCRVLA